MREVDARSITVENELEVFKRACFTAENEKRLLSEEIALLRQKIEGLESQKCVRCHGHIFAYRSLTFLV